MLRAKAGDRFALQRLLLDHHARLRAAIQEKIPVDLRRLISPDDICQEAYIISIRELTSFSPDGEQSYFAWLLVIADRRLLDAIRLHRALKRGGGKTRADEAVMADSTIALLEHVAASRSSPSESVCRREAIAAVEEAVEQLDPNVRAIIRLRYFEGLSWKQVAEQTGRTEGVVRHLCASGTAQLAQILGDPNRFFSSI